MSNDALLAEVADLRSACAEVLADWEATEATRLAILTRLQGLAERLDLIHGALQEKLGEDNAADWWRDGPQDE